VGGGDGVLALVDEDDIRVYRAGLPVARAEMNLANVAARLPDEDMVSALLAAYLAARPGEVGESWEQARFRAGISHWQDRLARKRAQRNITERRRFD
jgi:hypothetical protein